MNYNVEKNINKFCVYMNEKAKTIGMRNSTFYDPAGVYNDSTAEDIILCLLEASNTDIIKNLLFIIPFLISNQINLINFILFSSYIHRNKRNNKQNYHLYNNHL